MPSVAPDEGLKGGGPDPVVPDEVPTKLVPLVPEVVPAKVAGLKLEVP